MGFLVVAVLYAGMMLGSLAALGGVEQGFVIEFDGKLGFLRLSSNPPSFILSIAAVIFFVNSVVAVSFSIILL